MIVNFDHLMYFSCFVLRMLFGGKVLDVFHQTFLYWLGKLLDVICVLRGNETVVGIFLNCIL